MSHPVSHGARRRFPFALLQSPAALLNAFCGTASLAWFILLAVTFTDRSILILAVSLIWFFSACLALLLGLYLSRQRLSRRQIAFITAVWILGTLIFSNSAVAYWQSQHRLWSGFLFDSRYGWYPEPNLSERPLPIPKGSYVASTDELGHRNRLPYPANHVLPAILQGDSNAFGFGLAEEETLSAVLNSLRPRQAVYNVGVPGFDLNQYYFQYADLASKFQIQHRIILWNVGNDFTLSALETPNFFRRPYLYVEEGSVRYAPDFRAPFPVQGYGQSFIPPYADYNGLIQTAANDWADIYPELLIRVPLSRQLIRTYHPKICRVGELVFRKTEQIELFAPGWMLLKRELWPAPFSRYADDLPRLLRELKRQNPRLTICLFPFREQIVPEEFRDKQQALFAAGYAASDIEPLAFNRYFKTLCEAESIQVVDPTPQFLREQAPLSLYQIEDQHLSAKGIRLCADELKLVLPKSTVFDER